MTTADARPRSTTWTSRRLRVSRWCAAPRVAARQCGGRCYPARERSRREFAHRRAGASCATALETTGCRASRSRRAARPTTRLRHATASQLRYDGYRDWNNRRQHHVNFQVGRYCSAGTLTFLGNFVDYDALNPAGSPQPWRVTARYLRAECAALPDRREGPADAGGATWEHRSGGAESTLDARALAQHRQPDSNRSSRSIATLPVRARCVRQAGTARNAGRGCVECGRCSVTTGATT